MDFSSIYSNSWEFKTNVDPIMRDSKYLVTLDAEINDTDTWMEAPKLENYYEMNFALSDVPSLGDVIGNIPVDNVKVGLDAGFGLKYSNHMKNGLHQRV